MSVHLLHEVVGRWLQSRTEEEKAAVLAFFHLAEPQMRTQVRFRVTRTGRLSLVMRATVSEPQEGEGAEAEQSRD